MRPQIASGAGSPAEKRRSGSFEWNALKREIFDRDIDEVAQPHTFGRIQDFEADEVPFCVKVQRDSLLDIPALGDRYLAKMDIENIYLLAILDFHE
jgi:hypothetical protein